MGELQIELGALVVVDTWDWAGAKVATSENGPVAANVPFASVPE
jgi:hypothetical protein